MSGCPYPNGIQIMNPQMIMTINSPAIKTKQSGILGDTQNDTCSYSYSYCFLILLLFYDVFNLVPIEITTHN